MYAVFKIGVLISRELLTPASTDLPANACRSNHRGANGLTLWSW